MSGHFDLQSSAYELEEHLQKSSSDHISVEHLTTTFSTKAHSRWTSIRPHLSSSVAEQGLEDVYDSQKPRLAHNFGSNSLPIRALFGTNSCRQYPKLHHCTNYCAESETDKLRISSLGK